MNNLKKHTKKYINTNLITQSAATPGAFPAIFASQYYPMVYDEYGDLKKGTQTLPSTLSNLGYSTGGFISSNPFISRFESDFERFWNGDNEDLASGKWTQDRESVNKIVQPLQRAKRILTLSSDITATDTVTEAKEWFKQASSPRFLFIHLMEPHAPFYPGLKRGFSVGLLGSYFALRQYYKNRKRLSESQVRTIKQLYAKCIEYLDYQITYIFEFLPEGSIIIITADHGEEFEHGVFRHARLYDECVKVPLIAKNLNDVTSTSSVRQIDLSPTILKTIESDLPEQWEGLPTSPDQKRPSYIMNWAHQLNEAYVALRSRDHKLIKTYNSGMEIKRTELYNLKTDPKEKDNLATKNKQSTIQKNMEKRLSEFINRDEIRNEIYRGEPDDGNEREINEQRLKHLGYIE